MSVHLDLLIPNPEHIGPHGLNKRKRIALEHAFSFPQQIRVQQDYRLFAQLTDLLPHAGKRQQPDILPRPHIVPRPIPPNVRVFVRGEELHRSHNVNRLEGPLTFVTAEQLHALRVERSSPWNRALKALLDALPPATPIVLYWH